ASLEDQVASLEDQVASLEDQVASLEEQVGSLEAQVASQEIKLDTYEQANAELERRIAAWSALSESRTFRVLRAYRFLRSRLCGQTLDLPF
ncbi:hypothetical protein, partial [uncultured Desulfobacter sp.]|uniref:hypothetical protein n=1 Tax=uncultured Desulfobacter sp. TaxID=240139 RepID=UPI00259B78A3